MDQNYSSIFYDSQREESVRSANRVVSLIAEVLAPKSVLDVGCGAGGWVQAFKDAGVPQAHGVDGAWARASGLLIPESDFIEYDFIEGHVPFAPKGLLGKYDLVTSFEVVEHLPPESATALADFFADKADSIIIGAAIPGQGGSHHVNEQWPSYWAQLMVERGYQPCDFIRPALWDDETIMPWYIQNSIAYFREHAPTHVLELARREWEKRIFRPLSLVHPRTFAEKCNQAEPSISNVRRLTDLIARRTIKRLIRRA